MFYWLGSANTHNWILSQSTLSVGEVTDSVLENINLMLQQPKHSQPSSSKTKVHDKTKAVKQKSNVTKTIPQPAKALPNTHAVQSAQSRPKVYQSARLANTPPPLVYPAEAIKENVTGKVKVKGLVNEMGKVVNVEVLTSSGSDELDVAAKNWFMQLNFQPANDGAANISSFVTQTISFILKDNQNSNS